MFRPTEMSSPPSTSTSVIPTAAMPSGEACCSTSRALFTVRKRGLPAAKKAITSRKMA